MYGYLKIPGILILSLVTLYSFNPKGTVPVHKVNCEVKGIYTGTGTATTGQYTTLVYNFLENNFVKGGTRLSSPYVTFGGYRNTCDSVFLSVYYTANDCYYLLEGKLSNSANTINGTFKNLTIPSNTGTFILNKIDADGSGQDTGIE